MKKDVISRTIKTYESIAERYFKNNSIEPIKDIADKFINKVSGKMILDVGCGPGTEAKYLTTHGLKITGIDLTSKFLKIARKHVPKARFIKMDMRKLKFPNDKFDGSWVAASFLHIPKSQSKKTLLGLRRVLKPSGLIYISVKKGIGERFMGQLHGAKMDNERFFSFYSKKGMMSLLKSSGFKIIYTNKKVLVTQTGFTFLQ